MKINEKRRELQLQAVEALEQADYNGIAIAPTGTGKGWVMIECLRRINPTGRVWYLCDSENNRDVTFKEDLIYWGAKEWVDKIEYMCYQTAYKLEGQEVELCLADEMDFAISPEYVKGLQNNKFKHLVCVSATLEAKKRALAQSLVPIVFERNLKEIEDLGILNSARHHIVNFKLNEAENKKYLDFSSNFVRLLDNPRRNHKRLEMLQIQRKQFLSHLSSAHNVCRRLLTDLYKIESNKIIVFCGLNAQADRICKYSYHSASTEDWFPAFDRGEIRVISVVGKIDRGVNIDGVNTVIFESPTKSATKFIQRSGRSRRLPVEQTTNIYYLIPHFIDRRGELRPTIVKNWVYESTSKINFKPEIYRFL